jgi:hypothetical protein
MELLAECIEEARQEIELQRLDAEVDAQERRAEALRLVQHKLKQMSFYVHKSQRALNDLRTLRRLLFDERGNGIAEEVLAARMNGRGRR